MAEDNKINYLEWIRENIKYIFIGISMGILLVISYKYYEYETDKQSLKASELYYKLVLYSNDDDEIKNISNQIINNYSKSIYYPLTLFYLAKISHDKYDYKSAEEYLNEVINEDYNETYTTLAKIRLSRVYLSLNNYSKSLDILEDINEDSSFSEIVYELKGDIYKYKNNKNKALEFYEKALDSSVINKELLLMKKNDSE
ncbi:MAG: tetratricopeptide repeat protein [Pseudomonadota bacterium]|nr:tetratricopeptide repeat protein [Pseudomonadota bacterium]|tara:strand:+ start:542 stop:1141 length:600 start_codon:yes stop_codon:yes gene_type:complete